MVPPPGHGPVLPSTWYDKSWQAQDQRVFLVSVELWSPAAVKLSSSTLGSVRKPALPRRVSEKRESIGVQVHNEERRLREKHSWFRNHVNSPNINGSWKSATCKLSEEGASCILNIYVDESILQRSVYIHLLRCTDIRRADRSLFMRTDCLGIHVKTGQVWLGNDDDVIYVKFGSSDMINTWIALLRSYATPETYGRSLAPDDGGLYRMWRQVHLEIKQARNLGSTRPQTEIGPALQLSVEAESSQDGADVEIFCEVLLNNSLAARTTAKKGMSAEWHERFTFSDLPPFGDLLVHLYKRKHIKAHLIGTITINLSNFRRGEKVEGWFPIHVTGQTINGLQIGEAKLKLTVNEEIILPREIYSPMLQSMSKGNMLRLLNEVEQDLKLSFVAEHFMAVAVVEDVLMKDLFELTEREVTSSPQHTLFRGNTVLTKTMELVMQWYGRAFLEASIGAVIRRLCSERMGIEVDPVKSGRGQKDQEKNVEQLIYWCNQFWNSIYGVRNQCPPELRILFQHIRSLVEKASSDDANSELKWQSVSAFCFLRFFIPAILNPHMFELCHGMPPLQVQRSLTLIAKVLQRLANLNTRPPKEEYMQGIVPFIEEHLKAMREYIETVSTPSTDSRRPSSPVSNDKHERLQVINALRERGSTMTTLHREALVFLPHLLDVPKHLSTLCSSVLRYSRQQRSRSPAGHFTALEQFTKSCEAVERATEQRITLIMNSTPLPNDFPAYPASRHFNSGSVTTEVISADLVSEDLAFYKPHHRKVRSLRSARPSTAPSLSDREQSSSRRGRWDDEDIDPVPANLERNSADSSLSRTHADLLLRRESSRNSSLDKRASLDGSQAGSSSQRGLTGPLATEDQAVDFTFEQRKRRGLLRSFLPKK